MTFSILGRDEAGRVGVAVASCVLAIGSRAAHLFPGVGAAVVQGGGWSADADVLRDAVVAGLSADDAVLRAAARGRAKAQYAVLPVGAAPAAWTGDDGDAWSGHARGHDFSAQGNTLVGPAVVDAVAQAWQAAAGTPLEERLVLSVRAGAGAGGDVRGQQSAALLTAGPDADDVVDLRVDDAPDPLDELSRLVGVLRAHEQLKHAWQTAPVDLPAAARAITRARALAPYDGLVAQCAAAILVEVGDPAGASEALATARARVPALDVRLRRWSQTLPWFTDGSCRKLLRLLEAPATR